MKMKKALAAGLSLDLQCSETYSLAEQLAGVRLIQRLKLTNCAQEAIDGLQIVFEIPILKLCSDPFSLQTIHGRETVDFSDLPFTPDLTSTQELTENEKSSLVCKVFKDGEVVGQSVSGFELLVSNAWKIGAWELYASFITPNHPVISQVCKQISSTLSTLGFRNSLEGYQSGSSERIEELVRATYQTLSTIGVSYIDPPQFWTSGFQRIRLPDQVLGEGLGTCADLTPLAAACLEHIGLSPVVVFVNGHVFPGSFTNPERAPELPALIDDVDTIYSLCDAGELALFDSSEYAANPESGLEGAKSKARDYLSSFIVLVNIYQARRNGYRPLPIRMAVQPDQEGEVLSLAKQILLSAATQNIPVPYGPADPKSSDDASDPIPLVIEKRFQRWKERLLDLSTRNRLLHIENVDLSKIAVRYFHETALQVLLKLAYEMRDEKEVADAIIGVASTVSPDDIRPANFSYQRQLCLGDYFAQLISLLPEPLQDVCGEMIAEDRDTIIQSVFSKINSALGNRKSAYLALDVPSGLLGSLEDLLASGRELTILGDSLCGDSDEALAITAKELSSGIVRSALTIGCNEALSGELLYRAGRTLAREGRVSVEESGFSPLYLAFGLLQWKETNAAAPRIAPLFLYPIEIALDSRTQKVKITRSKSDPIGNITLVEKLRRDLDLNLNVLSDLPADDSGVDLDRVLAEVRSAIAGRAGWKVLEMSLITSFSFGKFLLWRDLQDNSQRLLKSSTVRHIATAGRDYFADPLSNLQISDLDQAAYQDLPIVLPSDSSQLAAVYSALKGRSFVLQGPPGTGKSQTIANIIASAMAKGKTVLFVAEKAAAAEVVARRLRSIGLGEFCLDLHHPDTNSEEVLHSFDQALSVTAAPSNNWESHCAELEGTRAALRELASILHQRHAIGYTLFEMASVLSAAQDGTQPVSQLNPLELSAEQFAANQREIQTLVHQLQSLPSEARSVWEFVGPLSWSLKLDSSLSESLSEMRRSLRSLIDALSPFNERHLLASEAPLSTVSQLLAHAPVRPWQPLPPALVDKDWWLTSQEKARAWIARKSGLDATISSLSERWSEQAFLVDLSDYQGRIERRREKNFIQRWILGFQLRRDIKRYLRNPRQSFPEILRDLNDLRNSHLEGSELEEEMRRLEGSLGAWDGQSDSLSALIDRCNQLQSDMETVADPAQWLHSLQSIPEASWASARSSLLAVQQALAVIGSLLEQPDLVPVFPPEQSLTGSLKASDHLANNLGLLRDWCSFSQLWDQFSKSHLGPILDWEIADDEWPALPGLYKVAVLKGCFNHCFDEHVQLREFDPQRHDILLQHFRALEEQYLEQSRAFVRAQVVARMPDRSLDAD